MFRMYIECAHVWRCCRHSSPNGTSVEFWASWPEEDRFVYSTPLCIYSLDPSLPAPVSTHSNPPAKLQLALETLHHHLVSSISSTMAQIRGTAGYNLGHQNPFGGPGSADATSDPSPLDAIREQTSKIEDWLDSLADPVKPYVSS